MRAGIAFSPTNMRNTVFRAGFGMNYDALAYSTMASMLPTVPPGYVSTEFTNIFTPIFGFFGNGGLIQTAPTNVFNPSVTAEEARVCDIDLHPESAAPVHHAVERQPGSRNLGRFMLNVGYLGIPSFNLPFQNVLNQTARVSATQNLPLLSPPRPVSPRLNAVTTNLGQLEAMNNNPLAGAGFTSPIFSYASECRSWYDGLLVRGSQRFRGGPPDGCLMGWLDYRTGPSTIPSTTTGIQPISRRCGTSVPSAARASTSFATSSRNMIVSGVYTYQSGPPLALTPPSMWDSLADSAATPA